MKNNLLFIIAFIFLIFQIHSRLTEEERRNLLNKLTKKISMKDIYESTKKNLNEKYLRDEGIPYDKEKIDEIIKKYDFPQNYNYLEDTKCPTVVKDQASCGCCWSHAATTSLAYRYHKIGVEVDLSPQDALSCYLRDCEAGNFLIDPELNLVKNGTVTEGCLPFSSGDGVVRDECPTKCKDGSEFKKYYAQNAYMTEDYYSEDTFYEIVTLMMDEIIRNGPLVTGIDVFYDFMMLHYDEEKCHNTVYTYDGISPYLGGHAVVIVGFGLMDSKYYWLIQNSWGEYACDHGFVKVEFGQIGVEQISFVEPYIPNEGVVPKDIKISFNDIDEECNLEVSTSSSLSDWKNTLDLGFKHVETNKKFNFQCSSVNVLSEKKNVCYFEYWNFWADKGIYKFNTSQSLGVENTFTVDSTFEGKEFKLYGLDELLPLYIDYFYISQEGSKILFLYFSQSDDDEPTIPPIYANIYAEKPLRDCNYIDFEGYYFAYCDLKNDEIDYFDDMYTMDFNPIVYSVLCGAKESSYKMGVKLDTTKYPVFKVNNFILPEGNTISSESILTGVADIEGSISGYFDQTNTFFTFLYIEIFGDNYTAFGICELTKPKKIMKKYLFNCQIDMAEGYDIPYDNIYVLPFTFQDESNYPYEIYIKDEIKAQKYDPNFFIPKIQVYIESLCPDCVEFITTSFKDFYEKVEKPNLAEIEFIPFGNAKEKYNTSTQQYDFECQHGENECYGNLMETCAIQIQGRVKSYETILCIETNIAKYQKNFDKTLEFCLSEDVNTLEEIQGCMKSDIGNLYEHQMAQKTLNHSWVPWVVVDGYHDEKIENEIIASLINYLCGDDKTKCYSE